MSIPACPNHRTAVSGPSLMPSFEGSRKVYTKGSIYQDLRIPAREVVLEEGKSSLRLYDVTGPYTDPAACLDLSVGLVPLRRSWAAGCKPTQMTMALAGVVTPEMEFVAR